MHRRMMLMKGTSADEEVVTSVGVTQAWKKGEDQRTTGEAQPTSAAQARDDAPAHSPIEKEHDSGKLPFSDVLSDAAFEAVVVSDDATSEGTGTDSDDALIDVGRGLNARRKRAVNKHSSDALDEPPTAVDTDSDDAVIDLSVRRKRAASNAASSGSSTATASKRASKQSSKRPRLSSPAREAVAAAVGGPSGAARYTGDKFASALPKQAQKAPRQQRTSSQTGREKGAGRGATVAAGARSDSGTSTESFGRRGRGNGSSTSDRRRSRGTGPSTFERLAEAVSAHGPSYTSEQDRAFMDEIRAESAAYVQIPPSLVISDVVVER